MKTLVESVQVYKPAAHDSSGAPEIKLIGRRKITIYMVEGSAEDARWLAVTLHSVLGELAPSTPPTANN